MSLFDRIYDTYFDLREALHDVRHPEEITLEAVKRARDAERLRSQDCELRGIFLGLGSVRIFPAPEPTPMPILVEPNVGGLVKASEFLHEMIRMRKDPFTPEEIGEVLQRIAGHTEILREYHESVKRDYDQMARVRTEIQNPPGAHSRYLTEIFNRNCRVASLHLTSKHPNDVEVLSVTLAGVPINLGTKGMPLSAFADFDLGERPARAGQSFDVSVRNIGKKPVRVTGGVILVDDPYGDHEGT